jgi:hypothetical protein
MIVDDIYTEIEWITETDSTVFPDVDKLRGLNIDQGEALELMLYSQGYRKVGESTYYTDFIATTGLSEGDTGYNGEYVFATMWVKPTEFYVKFPNQNEYVKCNLYDTGENPKSEFDTNIINGTFSQSNPYVRFARDSFYVRPLNTESTVNDGIMVVAEPRNTDLTSTTETPILDPIFHRWYVLKQALRYGKFRTNIQRSDVMLELQLLEKKIRKFYSERLKTPTKLKTPVESFK